MSNGMDACRTQADTWRIICVDCSCITRGYRPCQAHREHHFAWCPSCDIRMNHRAYLAAGHQCNPPEHDDMLWPR